MPRCRRAVSVWSGLVPDNQKPTGGGPAEGTAAPGRCGVSLEGLGVKTDVQVCGRLMSLEQSCTPRDIQANLKMDDSISQGKYPA